MLSNCKCIRMQGWHPSYPPSHRLLPFSPSFLLLLTFSLPHLLPSTPHCIALYRRYCDAHSRDVTHICSASRCHAAKTVQRRIREEQIHRTHFHHAGEWLRSCYLCYLCHLKEIWVCELTHHCEVTVENIMSVSSVVVPLVWCSVMWDVL